jgi:hypothetical protein
MRINTSRIKQTKKLIDRERDKISFRPKDQQYKI